MIFIKKKKKKKKKKNCHCLSQNGQFDDHPGSQSDQFATDRVRQNGQSCQFYDHMLARLVSFYHFDQQWSDKLH